MDLYDLITDVRNVMTIVSMLTFAGICWWAYSGRRSAEFETAANLPFADEMDTQAAEKQHG